MTNIEKIQEQRVELAMLRERSENQQAEIDSAWKFFRVTGAFLGLAMFVIFLLALRH